MITHNLVQGSSAWHAYRATHDNASDAPAMMGCSSYKTRDQLIAELATGITPEVDPATQRLYDSGHRFEKLARPLAEEIIGEDLYPCTGSVDGSRLSASFDGLNMLEDPAWEHKRMNERLRAVLSVPGCTGADLPLEYQVQMEQQSAVSQCSKVLFTASDWDASDNLIEALHCWYTPNPELRARILAGWEQLHKDVATYVPPEPKPAPVVAEPMESLPAVSMRLDGKLAVVSNLPDFATALRAFIERIPAKPDTDQDFANAESACKALKRAEDALTAGEDAALGEMVDFEAMRRQVRDLKDLARATRLATEKLVTARKEQIRGEIVAGGVAALRDHIASLNTRLGKPCMPQVPADFGGVVKGKRTVDSLRGAVNDELARAKIAANEIADRIQVNLNTLRELASAHAFLFADTATIVLKQPDDLTILVKSRIAEHEAAEAARLEAYRERIRFEELAKLQRETAAQARAELDRQRAAEESAENERNQALALANQAQAAIEPVASPADNVVPMRVAPVPAERTGTPTLKLGQIAERLGFTLTADFLKGLGFEPAATDRASKLYFEADFPLILAALVRHIEQVQARAAA